MSINDLVKSILEKSGEKVLDRRKITTKLVSTKSGEKDSKSTHKYRSAGTDEKGYVESTYSPRHGLVTLDRGNGPQTFNIDQKEGLKHASMDVEVANSLLKSMSSAQREEFLKSFSSEEELEKALGAIAEKIGRVAGAVAKHGKAAVQGAKEYGSALGSELKRTGKEGVSDAKAAVKEVGSGLAGMARSGANKVLEGVNKVGRMGREVGREVGREAGDIGANLRSGYRTAQGETPIQQMKFGKDEEQKKKREDYLRKKRPQGSKNLREVWDRIKNASMNDMDLAKSLSSDDFSAYQMLKSMTDDQREQVFKSQEHSYEFLNKSGVVFPDYVDPKVHLLSEKEKKDLENQRKDKKEE